MNLRLLAGLVSLATAGVAFAAAAQAPPGCFYVRDIGDRTVGGPHTLYFKVKDRAHMHAVAYYRIETDGVCATGAAPTQHAAYSIRSVDLAAADAKICKAADLRIQADSRCWATSMERMSRREVAALPRLIQP